MSSSRTVEVVVVGAGPAGVAAALTLHRGGADVLVVDKARFPRDKTCGDGLTTLALRELERLGFDPAAVDSWQDVRRAFLHAPSGRIVTLPLPQGPGTFSAVVPRRELDAALVELAVTSGVAVEQGAPLVSASPGEDDLGARLGIDGLGEVRARWVIGADGMWSPLRRLRGHQEDGYRGEWHAFRQYVRDTGPGSRDLHVWFEPDLLPGYVWSFPLPDGRANIGFGVVRGAHLDGGALARLWPELLTRPAIRRVLGPRAEPESPHRAWPIPAGIGRATLADGDVLYVGDAARAADVLTGEGIGQALLSGRLAAEAILASRQVPSGPDAGERYRHAVLHELGPDDRMATVLNRLLSRRGPAEAAIRTVGLSSWTRRQFARWLFEDSPRGIALTPRRWHRGALSGPPSFPDRSRPPALR